MAVPADVNTTLGFHSYDNTAVRGDVIATLVSASVGERTETQRCRLTRLAVAVAVLSDYIFDWVSAILHVDLSTILSTKSFDKDFGYHSEAQADQVWPLPSPSSQALYLRSRRFYLTFSRPKFSRRCSWFWT